MECGLQMVPPQEVRGWTVVSGATVVSQMRKGFPSRYKVHGEGIALTGLPLTSQRHQLSLEMLDTTHLWARSVNSCTDRGHGFLLELLTPSLKWPLGDVLAKTSYNRTHTVCSSCEKQLALPKRVGEAEKGQTPTEKGV